MLENSDYNISFTESAAQHITTLIKNRGRGLGLRVGVKKSGCSGYAYKLDFVDETLLGDNKIEMFGANIYVSSEDLPILSGLELDYKSDKMSSQFVFNNPNVKASCGCGESFAV